MCGRFTFHATPEILARYFAVADPPSLEPRYNIAPSQAVPIVRAAADGQRRLELVRWGLIPFWAKDAGIGNRLINARAETLAEKASFKHALKRRRCLILASGFYEWQSGPGGKSPVYVSDPSGCPYAFAGLWERWGEGGSKLESCVIITVPANAALRGVHDRMPAILSGAQQGVWLDSDESPADCQRLLLPAANDTTQYWPVSRRVNDPSHEGEDLIAPAPEA